MLYTYLGTYENTREMRRDTSPYLTLRERDRSMTVDPTCPGLAGGLGGLVIQNRES